LRARKRFGQHFLEPAWVEKVVRAIDPKPDQVFIEIGPGRGVLTRPLAARAKAVVAFEIDRDLASELRSTSPPNVTIVEGDFLEADTTGLPKGVPIRAAGNLPYNVGSPILFKLLAMARGPRQPRADRGDEPSGSGMAITDATLMLQREVADRLVADPGTKDYGVLTVLVRHSASVARVLSLPPGAFRPPPKVHSAVVVLRFHLPDPPVRDAAIFAAVVQAAFNRRRKTLANALDAYRDGPPVPPAIALERAGIDGRRRAETLSVAEFARLADAYAGSRGPLG
jgi:16S rRNA (adenine1518-N6/adenine1519-N6)-dimethyltransferase